ncbi:sugar phosphate nucleotidyltransferase [Steroidobacter sp.]|uniref:sugar phosphate nucleotidyltransferase n=1 Tax=Steroidobacter sp. TaxID=1978227 RepID=UPI0032C22B5C
MWGIVPAAGQGSRIQPLAFSKELLPVGSRVLDDVHRPRAVSEYLLERMIRGGAAKICFVIGAGKSDILEYFGASFGSAGLAYVVQPRPAGLCDAVFRAAPLIAPDDTVAVGLPDTIWFPEDALATLPDDRLSFVLFPVERPEQFDAVALAEDGTHVTQIKVKQRDPGTRWIWGAFKMPACVFHELHELWLRPERNDEYFGTLVNAYLERGGEAFGCKAGEAYVDVGTLQGYHAAMRMLNEPAAPAPPRHSQPNPAPEELRS